ILDFSIDKIVITVSYIWHQKIHHQIRIEIEIQTFKDMANNYARGAPANVQEEEHQQPLAADLDRANDEYWMNLWSNNNRAPANVQEEEHQQPLAADLDRANDEYWMNLWSNNNSEIFQ
uniref:Uncharacterized protein n=1 Tax=Clytia hemisphaerica TaxID=252671 RepID=A0A7M5WZD1_9CNID